MNGEEVYSDLAIQDNELEEGEEDEAMEEVEEGETVSLSQDPFRRGGQQIKPPEFGGRKYENTQTLFGVGLLPTEKKLQERAARFGITSPVAKRLTEENLEKLYDSCKVPMIERELRKQFEEVDPITHQMAMKQKPHFRLNTLHCRGVDEMSTEDVFRYFSAYGPLSIEWIDDTSCNVVWENRFSAARALSNMSVGVVSDRAKRLEPEKRVSPDETSENKEPEDEEEEDNNVIVEVPLDEPGKGEDDDMDFEEGEIQEDPEDSLVLPGEKLIHPKDVAISVPPNCVWRLGPVTDKAKAVLMRFATVEDKKVPRAERKSQYYRKYGNPNFDGMTGIISESRKRRYLEERGQNRRRGRGQNQSLDRLAVAGATVASMNAYGLPTEGMDKKNPWGTLAATWNDEWRAQDAPNTPPAPPPSTHSPKSSVRDIDSDLNVSFSDASSGSSSDSDDVVEWESRNKRPRMRMYADDVETAVKMKQKLHRRNRARSEKRIGPGEPSMVADLEEAPRADPSLRTRVDDERPRSRRNHRYDADEFVTDLRRRLSQSAKNDDEEDEDAYSGHTNGSRLEKEAIRVTINNGDRDRGRRRHDHGRDSSDDDDDDSDDRRRRPRLRHRHRQERARHEESLRSRLRLPDGVDDDDSDAVEKRGVPDLREKLRKKSLKKKEGQFSPLRIEIDNEEYYGIIGSESD